jgi:hypothetical protein
MNWKSTLARKCAPLKMEPVVLKIQETGEEKVIFYSANAIKDVDKAILIQSLPSTVEYDFKVSPKPSTAYLLNVLVASVNGTVSGLEVVKIYLPAESHIRPVEEVVQQINELFMIDEFFKSWTIFVGEEERKFTLAGVRAVDKIKNEKHDFRDTSISAGDVTDLRIMLETMDIDTFISSI